MHRKPLVLIVAALLAPAGAIALADDAPPKTPGLDQRQANQEQRIEKGKETGQLTEREAKRLEHAEDRLEKNEEKAKADGVVTARERKRLRTEAKVNSARIGKQKHDRQGDRDRKRDTNGDGK